MLQNNVSLIGTPDYGLIKHKPGWYNSVIVVQQDDPRTDLREFSTATFAFNSTDSQSGCHAMMFAIHESLGNRRLFTQCVRTGSHANSVEAIASGECDIAAIDAMSWRLLKRYEPKTKMLRQLTSTSPTPGLPYITAATNKISELTNATESAIAALANTDKLTLELQGLWRSTTQDYELLKRRAERSMEVLRKHDL